MYRLGIGISSDLFPSIPHSAREESGNTRLAYGVDFMSLKSSLTESKYQ